MYCDHEVIEATGMLTLGLNMKMGSFINIGLLLFILVRSLPNFSEIKW